jgi:outer membrane protein assembly factor BamB
MRRRLLLGGAVAVALLVAAAGAAFVLLRSAEPGDVRGSSTEEFVTTEATAPAKPPEPGVIWPTYGYTADRLRVWTGGDIRPPFKRLWLFRARDLVEFPPAVAYGRLYFANGRGDLFAVNAKTGKRAWRYRTGRCTAAAPSVDRHIVYMTFLNKLPCNTKKKKGIEGELIAFRSNWGRIVWRRTIGPTESSPLVSRGYVYVGDWTGRVYAFVARTGKVAWSFKTGGKIKGSVAISGDRLFVGSYDHNVYALDARTGKLLWKAGAQNRRFRHRGTFYATPAVAYGRVYIGATDSKVYSFGAGSGKTRWVQGTHGYVYSSAAVWRKRVYVGSYDQRLYALDAATGDAIWKFKSNGSISGSPTILNGVVYFSTLKRKTYALDARTGRELWNFPDGQYTPVVTDGERLYLVGHARVYGMVPR